MKTLFLTLMILISTITFSQNNGYDQHFYAGAGISAVTSGVTYSITHKKTLSVIIGTGAGILANALKEYVYDKNGGGVVNDKDFLYGSLGSLSAGITFRIIIIPSKWKTDLTPEEIIEFEEYEESERLLKLEAIPTNTKRQTIFNYYNKENRKIRKEQRKK